MPFTIVRQKITKMKVDAIVNAANTDLQMGGGGVCGAIFKAAGAQELQAACIQLAPIRTGKAAITPGFALYAKHIIHAVGPVYSESSAMQSKILLESAYKNALLLAVENNCRSIAFPLISSGGYGYPKDQALRVATSAIQDFLADHDIDVYLVVFDKAAVAVSEKLFGEVTSFIDEHYVETDQDTLCDFFETERQDLDEANGLTYKVRMQLIAENIVQAQIAGVDHAVSNLDEPFSATLLRLIDAKGKTDVDVYKRANIDRKLFSKIRIGKGYMPSKRTAIALAIALELNLDETEDLLQRAGYALSHSQKHDVIVMYFIICGKYDIFEMNEVLFQYDQPLLGG